MPTSSRSGAAAPPRPTKSLPPRPTPDAQEGGVKPALAGPLEKPNPVLQRLGFLGSIEAFNEKVQRVFDAHSLGMGKPPSFGLVFDVVRSPVDPGDYQRLFEIPQTERQARLRQVKETAHLHDDLFIQREDGLFHPESPLHRAVAQDQPAAPMQDRHPWVAQGFLPIKNFAGVVDAFRALSSPDEQAVVQHGGLTLEEYNAKLTQARNAGDILGHLQTEQTQGPALAHVQTIREGQVELNRLMGTDLPTTGYMNPDWLKTLHNWSKTPDYFTKTTKFLADQNGLTVHDFTQAWTNQQRIVREHPLAAHLALAMPLRTLVHPNSFWGNTKDLGNYIGGGGSTHVFGVKVPDPVSVPLHGLTRTAGLTLDIIGGTIQSAKADTAAATAFVAALQQEDDYDRAKAKAQKVLRENPSWLRIVDPSLAAHPHGWVGALDKVSNVALDLVLLRKPGLTGERVGAGDLAGAMRSNYVDASARMAHSYLVKGKLARAASMMEGNAGAERLAAASEKLIQDGKMSGPEFKQHLAELYATGKTEISRGEGKKPIVVTGPVLDSLRSAKLPTPGKSAMGWKMLRAQIRDHADQYDAWLRRENGGSSVANAVSFTRSLFSHAVSAGKHGYFDPRLPERVHDWTLSTFKDAKLANRYEDWAVRARANGDVRGVQGLFDTMTEKYHAEFPVGSKPPTPEPMSALLDTESPTMGLFPSGGAREADGFRRLIQSAQDANRKLNKVARVHTQAILSGMPALYIGGRSLAYKHIVGDTLRREQGGGFIFGTGLDDAKAQFETLLKSSPEHERAYGSFLERSKEGETRWLLDRGQAINRRDYSTGDVWNKGRSTYMEQAGAYVRRLALSDGVDAYRASSASDLSPLVDVVLNNRAFRGMWHSAQKEIPDLSAEEYAALVHARFQEFEQAGHAVGIADPLGDASAIIRENRGADSAKALGKWIKQNKIDFAVYNARPSQVGIWDAVTNDAISKIMVANKWNRGGMAKNVMLKQFDELTKAGWDPGTAAHVAMSVAEKQTVFHMLDFANRLKIEQDLRWVSYFATKHRLYYKWVMGTLIRNPGVDAALKDFQSNLDDKGNLDTGLSAFGFDLKIPAERLVWIPGREYSEISPLATAFYAAGKGTIEHGALEGLKAGIDSAAGTSGNLFTRQDTSLNLLLHLGFALGGGKPATYHGAVAGMDKQHRDRLWTAMNLFQVDYIREHGHPAPESYVVKHVLWKALAEEFWRANLPLPVVPIDKPNESQKLMGEFMATADPVERAKFLDEHPTFRDQLGIHTDPQKFVYEREFFAKYKAQHDAFEAARTRLNDEAVTTGLYTTAMEAQRRKLGHAWQAAFDQMLVADAKQSGVYHGEVPDGTKGRPFGRWGKVIESDPLVNPQDFIKKLLPNVKGAELGKVYGNLQADLRLELKHLDEPGTAATYDDPNEIKARKREIMQQLSAFESYPKDALGKLQQEYQQNVHDFFTEENRRYKQIHAAARDKQALLKAQFYAWRDSQDQPVVKYENGKAITFPSPARMAFAMLDPISRKQKLAYLASADWAHLTDFEKEVLTGEAKPAVSQGYLYLEQTKDTYRKEHPGAPIQSDQLLAVAKQIEKVVPGFYKDYLRGRQPLVRRFEGMTIYRDAPPEARKSFDAWIGNQAINVIKAEASGDYNNSQMDASWRNYVNTQLIPWINKPEQAALRRWLAPFGPNFLTSLVSR